MQKRNKAKHFMEKIILKGNIATTYIEDKHKNTGASVRTHPPNVEKEYH